MMEIPRTKDELAGLTDAEVNSLKFNVDREAANREKMREGWELRLVYRVRPRGLVVREYVDREAALAAFAEALAYSIDNASEFMREPDRVLDTELKLSWRYEHVSPERVAAMTEAGRK